MGQSEVENEPVGPESGVLGRKGGMAIDLLLFDHPDSRAQREINHPSLNTWHFWCVSPARGQHQLGSRPSLSVFKGQACREPSTNPPSGSVLLIHLGVGYCLSGSLAGVGTCFNRRFCHLQFLAVSIGGLRAAGAFLTGRFCHLVVNQGNVARMQDLPCLGGSPLPHIRHTTHE